MHVYVNNQFKLAYMLECWSTWLKLIIMENHHKLLKLRCIKPSLSQLV